MATYDFLPLQNTATLIRTFAEQSWPLQEETVQAIFNYAQLSFEVRESYTFFHTFTINSKTHKGYLPRRSFGIPRIVFYVCDFPDSSKVADPTPLANSYIGALINELRPTLGQPLSYDNIEDSRRFVWWMTPTGVRIDIEYGSCLPSISISGPSRPGESEDTLAMPSVDRCVEIVRAWTDAHWPMSVPAVHRTASALGWSSEAGSSHAFYSELPVCVHQANPSYYSTDYFAEPDVAVRYSGSEAGQISFNLAEYWSVRSEPAAFPTIVERMREVEAALRQIYGQPVPDPLARLPFSALWSLANGVTVSLQYGRGKANVCIRHPRTLERTPYAGPSIYTTNDVLHVINHWAQAWRGLSFESSTVVAKNLGWVPVNDDDPRSFYTPLSAPAEPLASLQVEDQHVWLVTFTLAQMKVNGIHVAHPYIESSMQYLEHSLTQHYGTPEINQIGRTDYRDWGLPSGARIRMAYGNKLGQVWIYAPEKRSQLDAMTAPMRTADTFALGQKYRTDTQIKAMRVQDKQLTKWHMLGIASLAGVAILRLATLLF